MSVLLRAAELIKRPVVTLAGEDLAQIKDVVYSSTSGELAGFTLNGRGMFAGPLRKTLPWENVHGLGPAAVMIRDESALADRKALQGETEGAGGAVLGSAVITQSGRNLGIVTDVILDVGDRMTDAVGYEIKPSDDSAPRRQFVPLPDTLSVSGEALMVPDAAIEFIRDDLAGFGAAVEEFRTRLRRSRTPGETTAPGSDAEGPSTPPEAAPTPAEVKPKPPVAPPEPGSVPPAPGSDTPASSPDTPASRSGTEPTAKLPTEDAR